MDLYEKLGILVDGFCDKNADVMQPNDILRISLRCLAFEAGMIALDHEMEVIRSMKKDSRNEQ